MTDDLKEFLLRNRIEIEAWEKSGCDWDTLSAIRADHIAQSQMLSESAALYANLIQKIPGVHSVRWRVKDADHLLEKIVRKRAEAEEKYANISPENYYEIITDLIGIRALHLFKDDCFEINKAIASIWSPTEKPVAYIRNGDPDDLIKKYTQHELEVKVHPKGYRSVHFVISSQPIKRKVYAEVQVRTIFEEGWSEIDHKIRYPNFSDNQLVGYFLTIFNRMAGSADEMGSFVTGLAASIQDYQLRISQASKEREENLKSIENLLEQLTKLKQQDEQSQSTIRELQEKVLKIKDENPMEKIFSTTINASDLGNLFGNNSALKALERLQNSTNSFKALEKLQIGSTLKALEGLQSNSDAFKRLTDLSAATPNLTKLLQTKDPKKE